MANTIEETTEQTWCGKIADSFSSVGIGLTLTFACIGFLFYNEHNLVATRRALTESESAIVDLPSSVKIDSAFDGKLVHVTGFATTDSVLSDDLFGLNLTKTLRFERQVEMYQWKEKESTKTVKKTGGKSETTTTYSYEKDWSSDTIDTSSFEKKGYENPPFPFQGTYEIADDIKLGAFDLPQIIVSLIHDYQPLPVDPSVESVPVNTTGGKPITPFEENGFSGFYIGNATLPTVGDIKVTFWQTPAQSISIVAKQDGSTLDDYTASNDYDVLLVAQGNKTVDEMFTEANEDLNTTTWAIRLVCLFVMWFGLALIADPIVALLDVLPLLGDCFQYINIAIAGLFALCLWIITVAIAWMFFRPVFSACVFGGVAALVIGVRLLRQSKKKDYEEIPSADAEAGNAVVA